MPVVLGAVSPFYAFEQSDMMGRAIVVILFAASILAWTIIVEKWLHIKSVERAVAAGLARYRKARGNAEAVGQGGPLRRIAEAASAAISGGADKVKASIETAVDEEVIRLETRLGLLGSIVGVSPFLGLLGTIWGVMMAFCGMAMAGRAEIHAIAPGVSGALLTTVVGLIVAIPALIGYNLLVGRVKQLAIKLDNFAHELAADMGSRGR